MPLALRDWFDPMFPEDVADGGVGDLVPEVGQGALDADVAPGRILAGHAQDQLDNLRSDSWSPRGLAAIAEVPLLGHELPVPAQDGVGGEGGADFAENLSAEDLALDRQAPPLVVVEPDPLLAVGFFHDLVLGAEVVHHLLLLPVDQAGEDGQEKLPGLKDEVHGCSDALTAKGEASGTGSGPSIG